MVDAHLGVASGQQPVSLSTRSRRGTRSAVLTATTSFIRRRRGVVPLDRCTFRRCDPPRACDAAADVTWARGCSVVAQPAKAHTLRARRMPTGAENHGAFLVAPPSSARCPQLDRISLFFSSFLSAVTGWPQFGQKCGVSCSAVSAGASVPPAQHRHRTLPQPRSLTPEGAVRDRPRERARPLRGSPVRMVPFASVVVGGAGATVVEEAASGAAGGRCRGSRCTGPSPAARRGILPSPGEDHGDTMMTRTTAATIRITRKLLPYRGTSAAVPSSPAPARGSPRRGGNRCRAGCLLELGNRAV
jgi:hypothetical protein